MIAGVHADPGRRPAPPKRQATAHVRHRFRPRCPAVAKRCLRRPLTLRIERVVRRLVRFKLMTRSAMTDQTQTAVRIDKWLWAARFFKTRGLAQTAIENGRVLVGGDRVKRARNLHGGELVSVRVGDVERQVRVLGLSEQRGPAPVAQLLYEETAESLAKRETARRERRVVLDPAAVIAAGRPTKRDRRRLEQWQQGLDGPEPGGES